MPSRGSIQESGDVLSSSSFFFTSVLISRQEEINIYFGNDLSLIHFLKHIKSHVPYCMSIFGFPLRAVNRWIPKILRYLTKKKNEPDSANQDLAT